MPASPAPVAWGVLGAADIAVREVIPAMQRGRLSTVVAIASRSQAKADAAARALGIPRAYGSYEALVADPAVEAIYIPLPNHLHVPWSIRAAEAGKHVLCEKPLALSADDARRLLPVRERTGVLIGEAFMVRSHPQWHKVRELLASGRIGELRSIEGHFCYYRRDPADVRSKVEWGGGVLLDVGCYPVTLSRWLYGEEPTAVACQLERDPDFKVDRLVAGMLRYPSGLASFTVASQTARFQMMQLLGTRGRIEVEIPFNPPHDQPCRIRIDDGRELGGRSAEVVSVEPANQFTLQGDAFSAAIRGDGAVPVTLEDGIANMTVLDALFRAAESGRWERLTPA